MSRNVASAMQRILAFCSPLYEDVALNELSGLLDARPLPRLAPGLYALDTSLTCAECNDRLHRDPPIFTRQIVGDAIAAERSGDPEIDARRVLQATDDPHLGVSLVGDAAGHCPPAVQLLRDCLPPSSGSPAHAALPVVVVATAEHIWAGRALAGAGLPAAPLWPGGKPELGYVPSLVSRSALKLIEALAVFGVEAVARDRALDLGASPGGWSQVLAGHGMSVTAVDPGSLDPRVLTLPGIVAHRATAQRFLAETRGRYDLIVDDMRLDARESARILAWAADILRSDGDAIITLKLPERRPSDILRQTLELLRRRFPIVQARCLYYNRHEVTAHARLT